MTEHPVCYRVTLDAGSQDLGEARVCERVSWRGRGTCGPRTLGPEVKSRRCRSKTLDVARSPREKVPRRGVPGSAGPETLGTGQAGS